MPGFRAPGPVSAGCNIRIIVTRERRSISPRESRDLLKNHLDLPTSCIQGDEDQIVPIGARSLISSKIVKGATLKINPGAPHGLCSTLKDQVNADLLAFIRT